MTYPLVIELAASGIPVRLSCEVLGFSPQAFYKWRANPCSDRDLEDAHLTNALIDLHADDPEFGYRFLTDELQAAGHTVGERRVWRLCRDEKLWSTTTKKGRKGSGKKPGPAVHDDLVQRNFTAERPDAIWLTDITEHPTLEGKLYGMAAASVDGVTCPMAGFPRSVVSRDDCARRPPRRTAPRPAGCPWPP